MMRKIGHAFLKLAIAVLVLMAIFRNPSLGWTFLSAGAAWFLVESQDSSAHALYANVMRFVMPSAALPFVMVGLRDVEFAPTSYQMFWICFFAPVLLGFCIAWIVPRVGESAAYRTLQSENRDAEAEIVDLRQKWGPEIEAPTRRRAIVVTD